MDITGLVSQLVSISREKKELLKEMFDITNFQAEAIKEESLDKLGLLIDEKQKRIDKIDALDSDFEQSFKSVKTVCGVNSWSDILRSDNYLLVDLKKEISEIMKVIRDIQDIEKKNSTEMSKQKVEVAEKLKGIAKGKMAANVYKGKYALPPKPAFFDKKK